jgi:hypothetical protein
MSEPCDLLRHNWEEEYYGYRCSACGTFIPFGSEPWLDVGDLLDIEEGHDAGEWNNLAEDCN